MCPGSGALVLASAGGGRKPSPYRIETARNEARGEPLVLAGVAELHFEPVPIDGAALR